MSMEQNFPTAKLRLFSDKGKYTNIENIPIALDLYTDTTALTSFENAYSHIIKRNEKTYIVIHLF